MTLFTILLSSCVNNDIAELDAENQFLKLIEATDLKNDSLFVYDLKDNGINYEIKDGWEVGWSDDVVFEKSKELCRGGGLSFAKCVKKTVDAGKCVTVYKDGDDYVAISVKCPVGITPAD